VLYSPEAFEPLTDDRWDVARVPAAIREIVADADGALRGPRLLWRADEWDSWHGTSPMKNLYVGCAGVIWALDGLRRRGHAETSLDLADLSARTLELFRVAPDFMKGVRLPEQRESALLTGETGILIVAWRLAPDRSLAETLLERVRANISNRSDELMWGVPGTLLAARAMAEWTGDNRWANAWIESADALWSRREPDGFWVQHLPFETIRGLSAPHGVVGSVLALLQGGELLERERREILTRETADLLVRTAVVENGLANWAYRDRPALPSPDGRIRLQWCCGAPGVVSSAASYLDEELMLAGAELCWEAGPHNLEKGPSICHGTAGNGYAFLKAFERTGDELWLERAQRFAVHALGQVERLRTDRGRGRYSLWTGDMGAALFAADCLDSRSSYPVVDSFDW
jgi:lanthionine synthetase-like protein